MGEGFPQSPRPIPFSRLLRHADNTLALFIWCYGHHHWTNKYTWIRVANGRVIERALMDYVLITKRMVGRLKDVHVFRGVAVGMSDHFFG